MSPVEGDKELPRRIQVAARPLGDDGDECVPWRVACGHRSALGEGGAENHHSCGRRVGAPAVIETGAECSVTLKSCFAVGGPSNPPAPAFPSHYSQTLSPPIPLARLRPHPPPNRLVSGGKDASPGNHAPPCTPRSAASAEGLTTASTTKQEQTASFGGGTVIGLCVAAGRVRGWGWGPNLQCEKRAIYAR
jgi:hypothetical protein